jgi:hypothetical protein
MYKSLKKKETKSQASCPNSQTNYVSIQFLLGLLIQTKSVFAFRRCNNVFLSEQKAPKIKNYLVGCKNIVCKPICNHEANADFSANINCPTDFG